MGRVGKASTDYKGRLSSSSTTTPYPSRTCVPKKGPPKLSRSSGHGTASYASPLANSPYQFRNKCTARKLFSSTKEPIQISRKGIYIKLYVKKVTQESVVQHSGYECHLAALDCFIPDYEYITETPIERAPKNGPHWGPD